MATTKDRINISVSKDARAALARLARRDEVPVATKASDLLKMALEIEEDRYFGALAEKRLREHKGRWIKDSDAIWK